MPPRPGFRFSDVRHYFPYILLLLVFVGGVWLILAAGSRLGPATVAPRRTGMTWSQSFSIGVLMNTRGLVELVVLNIGYDLGILSGRIFAMMVLMALVTTFMTGPLLSLVRTRK